jgi:allophanate hydrolase subunit 1
MPQFPRPATPTVAVPRESVPGSCPACGAAALASYPVLGEGGWWQVVKCQRCLHSVRREAGPLLGAFGEPRAARGGRSGGGAPR